MPTFQYTARRRNGEKVQGGLDANDRRAALQQLERLGLVPVSVAEPAGAAAKPAAAKKQFRFEWRRNARARMSLRDTLLLTRELSDLLESGMTLGNALHTLAKRQTNSAQDAIIAALRDDIIQGSNLSAALARWPETFSQLYVSMVRAGEVSGQLAQVLEGLVRHYERVLDAREKVTSALVYPGIILVFGTLTVIFAMTFIVPKFTQMFKQFNQALPLPTQILIAISDGFKYYGWFVFIVLFIGGVLLRRYVRTPEGCLRWHKLQLRIPVVKKIITANAFAHFARTLGSLLRNGVPVLQALTIVEDTVGNKVIAEAIHNARDRVTDGASISGPLAAGKVFPPLLTDMLAVGEQAGDPSKALEHIARRYDSELDHSVKMFTTLLEPIMLLLMALAVGFVAISMLLAVFDLTSGISS